MKKLLKTSLITVVLACAFNPLYAGGNHDHGHGHSHAKKEVSKSYVQKLAKVEVRRLFQQNKIDASWIDTSIKDTVKKNFQGHMEWVVSFNNKSIKDAKKQNLFVFIDLYGEITGANYTGE